MKPPPFSYHRGRSPEHAAGLLRELGPRARVLAGGQSLLPMLNLRLAEPAHLVDLGPIPDLGFVRRERDRLVVGATARQSAVEHSADVRALVPLLAEAVEHVAHPPIRHRGTVVGSIAHASAVAELPCAALALDARLTLLSADGVRTVDAEEFFTGPFSTVARSDEIVAQVEFPVAGPGTGQAWSEFSLRRGNFPVAGAAVSLTVADGRIVDVSIAVCGVADRPVRARAAEQVLRGAVADEETVERAAAATTSGLAPRAHGDLAAHILPVSAAPVPGWAYRASVARAQVRRAVTTALTRAGGTR
ncbi:MULTISPECIES: FAD binding domain-containing protein [Pseudonocardia]|uniref:Carbon-monoxide dehydrogenase (Acceptor) n=1 Tax=Pseudonocardia dioxanivorans (strain ATCC 55486 / DSM 44775 / JCM 13855 / CB1190) TaxID=675635 RepID=F4CPG6_PSEUX|nr:FAD binding domain-containing protein [Pseudonocardia dioxanivorans]AEA24464.1 Carbon-monoxide dehydrogenase (acceptor) [Pseudonocardia dioxanivorans CB1190]GJF01129.1 carbon monoxide dehydrogenase [Pseudonocardia sp. D17]